MLRPAGVSLHSLFIQEDSCNFRACSICSPFVKSLGLRTYFDVVYWVAVSEMSLEETLFIVVFNFLEMFVHPLFQSL